MNKLPIRKRDSPPSLCLHDINIAQTSVALNDFMNIHKPEQRSSEINVFSYIGLKLSLESIFYFFLSKRIYKST